MSTTGFDSAHIDRTEDHLNRWPFAKEIYQIATTACPKEWSVRIGIYGEWGTGKTCVLNFIEQMASADNHIIVSFNPWEYTNASQMWISFVKLVGSKLKPTLEQPTLKNIKAKSKKITGSLINNKLTKALQEVAEKSENDAACALSGVFDQLKSFFSFTPDELKELSVAMGEKRVIVMVDDLDRASSKVVPELFYGLKQILDIQGFSFICAFDPVVVGQILGEAHKGFGSGLKFLEKIIDYPRWLPQPTEDHFRKLAYANIDKYCNFVHKPSLDEILSLLPQNPRAIKQYIRLLSLLKIQITRHTDDELNWPVILLANVLKISFPQIAQELIFDDAFWKSIEVNHLYEISHPEKSDSAMSLIEQRVAKAIEKLPVEPDKAENQKLKFLVEKLAECSQLVLDQDGGFKYYMQIAEAPASVTTKEFNMFLAEWCKNQDLEALQSWIINHVKEYNFRESDVYSSLLTRSLNLRSIYLNRIASAPTAKEMDTLFDNTETIHVLLKQLILDLGGISTDSKRLNEDNLKYIFNSLVQFSEWKSTKTYQSLREQERSLLLDIVNKWDGDVTSILKALQPLSLGDSAFSSNEIKQFFTKLKSLILPRFVDQILCEFHKQGFIDRVMPLNSSHSEMRSLFFDLDGYFWRKSNRNAVFSMLKCAKGEINVQVNAYYLLHHYRGCYHQNPNGKIGKQIEILLSTQSICKALWKAATATPLNNRFVGEMKNFPQIAADLGVKLPIPRWWKISLRSLDIK